MMMRTYIAFVTSAFLCDAGTHRTAIYASGSFLFYSAMKLPLQSLSSIILLLLFHVIADGILCDMVVVAPSLVFVYDDGNAAMLPMDGVNSSSTMLKSSVIASVC